MEFLAKKAAAKAATPPTTKQKGDAAEDAALRHLQAAGLRPVEDGGILLKPFTHAQMSTMVEALGSDILADASVSATKQRRIIFAARHYLVRLGAPPPCRFDVVVVEPAGLQWLQGAFDAG